ncbi:hypothetical protein GKC30_06035 [Pseudodesulfovibrio sp. F-1]|uniref:Uncharacterized protein n=1 Tax=Pseudodesulfovibrio alkaliphilus TaxID=2661613 RepID=A0A7K1KM66_9BACT|nr:hypothetical protein [Pseudodesulfovibrio alkaliphilus]MUM77188.1 hypothetical protein [Pseudodesulfovibrio alkaliphilus]
MIKHALRSFLILMTVALFVPGPALAGGADIAGSYAVAGWDPGSDPSGPKDYEGTVGLTAWGEAWKYRGEMDGHVYVGVGFFDESAGTLSLSFTSEDGSEAGVTVLKATGDGFSGKWVFAGVGNGLTGREIWTRAR